MDRNLLHLDHIVEAIARIEEYVHQDKEAFLTSTLIQDAVIRNLQTLCESTQKLSSTLKQAHPEIDWAGLAFVRNTLTHEYLYLNMERLWSIVEDDLPKFKVAATRLLAELDN